MAVEIKAPTNEDDTRRRFTVAEYHLMGEAGVFGPDERVELIEGEIVRMSPIGVRHAACIRRLIALISEQVGRGIVLDVQDPLEVSSDSEPQPDISVYKPRADYYSDEHPSPHDALLLIEVSDSTLNFDRNRKGPLYARTGITEYWIVNLVDDLIEVYTKPAARGFSTTNKFGRGESVQSVNIPALSLLADDILGPSAVQE